MSKKLLMCGSCLERTWVFEKLGLSNTGEIVLTKNLSLNKNNWTIEEGTDKYYLQSNTIKFSQKTSMSLSVNIKDYDKLDTFQFMFTYSVSAEKTDIMYLKNLDKNKKYSFPSLEDSEAGQYSGIFEIAKEDLKEGVNNFEITYEKDSDTNKGRDNARIYDVIFIGYKKDEENYKIKNTYEIKDSYNKDTGVICNGITVTSGFTFNTDYIQLKNPNNSSSKYGRIRFENPTGRLYLVKVYFYSESENTYDYFTVENGFGTATKIFYSNEKITGTHNSYFLVPFYKNFTFILRHYKDYSNSVGIDALRITKIEIIEEK